MYLKNTIWIKYTKLCLQITILVKYTKIMSLNHNDEIEKKKKKKSKWDFVGQDVIDLDTFFKIWYFKNYFSIKKKKKKKLDS